MKILITGSKGFIGKNLAVQLRNKGYEDLLLYDLDSDKADLDGYLERCDFIFHTAGVNRPQTEDEFQQGNKGFTEEILSKLAHYANPCPILACSSIQAENDSPYGKSKRAMEAALFAHTEATKADTFVYRLPNVFGKWCKPNYNSVVATYCYNLSRDLEIKIHDPEALLKLVYIDDVVESFINALTEAPEKDESGLCSIKDIYTIRLGELAEKIRSYHKARVDLLLPHLDQDFDKKLYATYISYLPEGQFSYKLDKKTDHRGYFCECLKSEVAGQVSISLTKPGIERGNHWHNTKAEKFLVLQGKALIQFRKINSDEIIDYSVSGDEPEMVDIPTGYTHTIKNAGPEDLITLIWCSELFDPQKPDTYFEKI